MKRNFALPAAFGLLLLAGSASYSQTPAASWNGMDRDFATEVAQSDAAEIQAAELALERSHNVNVRRLAHMIIDHHKMSQDMLSARASSMNTTLSTQPSTEQSEEYDDLSKLNGDVFDHAYIKQQIEAHKKAVWRFQQVLQETNDQQTKTYAWGTLPLLKKHLMEFKYLKNNCTECSWSHRYYGAH